MSSKYVKAQIKSEVTRARKTLPAAALVKLNEVKIVPAAMVDQRAVGTKRRTYALYDNDGVETRLVAVGMRGIVEYLKRTFLEIGAYLGSGTSRWLSLSTAVAAYLHYAEDGPGLEHLRGKGIQPRRKSRCTSKPGALGASYRGDADTNALVRRELQRRIRKMPTSKLLKLLGKV